MSALLLMAKLVAIGTVGLMPVPAELSTITSARIMQLTNQERTRAGLKELAINDALSQAAAQKARDMLDHDYFAHISPTGVTPWFWMSNVGYTYKVAGENLAIDFIEAEDVVTAWMASPSHRDNILRAEYAETGVGVLTGEFEGATSIVVVHMFGLPDGRAAEAAPAAPAAAQARAPVPATPQAARAAAPVKIPTISLAAASAIQQSVRLTVSGEAGATVSLLVNNQARATLTLPASGTFEHTLSVADLPDGEVIIRAQAQSVAGALSELSPPQVVVKDTEGPAVADAPVLIASPATDTPTALVRLTAHDYAKLAVVAGQQELSFAPDDTVVIPLRLEAAQFTLVDASGNVTALPERNLLPSFVTEDSSYLDSSARFTQVIRRMTFAALLAILVLLTLAVAIRLHIQRPRMIVHALFVLGLAATLFVL